MILTWDAPTSSADPVAGYYAFRAPGGTSAYAQISATLITALTYTDLTVAPLTTYNYIVESVDAQGVTSAPSNTATVPTLTDGLSLPVPAKPSVTINP